MSYDLALNMAPYKDVLKDTINLELLDLDGCFDDTARYRAALAQGLLRMTRTGTVEENLIYIDPDLPTRCFYLGSIVHNNCVVSYWLTKHNRSDHDTQNFYMVTTYNGSRVSAQSPVNITDWANVSVAMLEQVQNVWKLHKLQAERRELQSR